jgi:hypothetical protein
VLEDEEIPQALERAAKEIIEEEPIPESPEISEDTKQASEEGIDQPSAPEFSELPGSADHVTPKEDGFTELATPELAEVYSHQGLIDEAISTYVKVLSANPEDETLKRRLAELRALKAERTEHQPISEDVLRAKKQKMITVMEDWLTRIQKLATFPLY